VPPLTVLHVTGWCRSGSTLLGNVLNEVEGIVHVGELHYLWRNGVLGSGSNTTCGCRRELVECPLWSRVLEGTPAGRAAEIVRWQDAGYRTRHTWRLLRRPPRDGYAAVLAGVYRSVQAATGARVIIDSSKFASEAAALLGMEGIRPAALHMVRDPRAVAWSWHRQKAYIGRRGALDSTWYWVGFNLAAEAVARRLPGASMRLRYEDFTAAPERSVRAVLELVGEPAERCPVRGRRVTLGGNHTVTGNPDRFLTGEVEIREDDAWRRLLPRPAAAAATALALPWLRRYGYPLT
jgi:Sulfotransferase family